MSGTIGNSATSAADYGCLIASTAMMATDMGHRVTPDELNARITAAGAYVGPDGDLMDDDTITAVFPDIRSEGARQEFPASLSLSRDEGAILCLDAVAYGVNTVPGSTHFVYAVYWDGSMIGWNDPWGGVYKTFSVAEASALMHDSTPVLKYRLTDSWRWWGG